MVPDYIIQMIKDPEEHDSEWGRSCRYCDSRHGSYDKPLEHYIDCLWWRACDELHIPIDPAKHAIFEPKPHDPCETCGWAYVSDEDWRGRVKPDEPGDYNVHVGHLARAAGMTVEEYQNRPIRVVDYLPAFHLERGVIKFVTPADLGVNWSPKVTFEGAEFEQREGAGGFCAPLAPLYNLQSTNTDRRPLMDADVDIDPEVTT